MKRISNIIALMTLALSLATAHAEKAMAGPKGGKLLETDWPRPEFFVGKDRNVTVTFYDKDLKPVAPGEQVVTAIAESKEGKKKIEFEKKGEALVSKTALPEGEPYNVVVQYKPTPDAKQKNLRLQYNTKVCGECKHAEYACICEGEEKK